MTERIKIGIITPTTGKVDIAPVPPLEGVELVRVVVADGVAAWEGNARRCDAWVCLPGDSANDAGATPRAVGATWAIGQGCNVIAFLDDDNRFAPEHLPNALAMIAQGAEVVASKRWNVSAVTGERMFVDIESDGTAFADTNTIVLAGKAAQFGTTWAWFRQPSGTDRVFWDRLRHSFGPAIACTGQPTVEYVTRWAPHYNPVGDDGKPIWQPPDPAKFVAEENGQRIALVAKPVWDGGRWVPEGYVRPYEQKNTRLP